MTAIHPDALLAAMPKLDAQVACEIDGGGNEPCDRPAVWRMRFHGVIRYTDLRCGMHTVCICDDHLQHERATVELVLRKFGGEAECRYCDAVFRQVSDVIQSVVAL